MPRTSLLLQKLEREITLYLLVKELRFLHCALSLMTVYQCIKFHFIPFVTFIDMLRTSFLLQKLRRGNNFVNTGDSVTDGRTVRRTDKAATVCFPFGEHKKGKRNHSLSQTPRGRENRQNQTSANRTNVRISLRLALSSPSEVIAMLKGLKNTRTK